MEKPLRAKKHCQGVYICLVGANRFQNDLFVATLKKSHGCKCDFIVSSCIEHLQQGYWVESRQQAFICIDCYGLDIIALKQVLCEAREMMSQSFSLALFNIPHNKGIEKKALKYGVLGFFYPETSPDDFCRGIKGILKGELWLSRELLRSIILDAITPHSAQDHQDGKKLEKLTKREREILELLATGARNEEIARELFLSTHTIRAHLYNIYRKIEVTNRTKASTWASKHLSE